MGKSPPRLLKKPKNISHARFEKRLKRLQARDFAGSIILQTRAKEKGIEMLKDSPWGAFAMGSADAISSIPRISELIGKDPRTFGEAAVEAGIVAAIGAATVAAAGGMRYGLNKYKAGKNFRRLKPLVWGDLKLAKEIGTRLAKIGLQREKVELIFKWGNKRE